MNYLSFLALPRTRSIAVGAAAFFALAGSSAARQVPLELFGVLALSAPQTPASAEDHFTEEELDDLLGPVALYPDVLLSAVLAASVYPDQVFSAAAFVAGGATPESIEAQSWEDPVKAVANVPEVIAMMNAYPEWTKAMGTAFLTQAWDVMASIQRLRKIARDNGVLETTAEHVVSVNQETQKIVIMPANPTVIFVPQYNPSVVFVRDNRAVARAGWIGFGTGVVVGAIIWGGSCNWNGGFIGWGRGWGWGGWSNTRVNNNININVNNNNNSNININRPDRPQFNRPGGRPDINQPGSSRPGISRPDISRPGADRPGISRPDVNRPGVNRPGTDRPSIDRPGMNRPVGNPSGINRPGGNRGAISRPGDRIGQEGARWQPERINRPGTPNTPGGNTGNRVADWRNNASRPESRPALSAGTNRPNTITRPNAPSNPVVNRPAAPPTQRPAALPATRAPNVQPARPTNPATLPSAGAGTGNRPSGFSGGPSNAAAARGAASRAGSGGGGGGGGGRGRG